MPWSAVPFPSTNPHFAPAGKTSLPSWPETPAKDFRPVVPIADASPQPDPEPSADFTDEDLKQALVPIFREVLDQGQLIARDPQLEPLLRATIRRALAENSPGNRPFRQPGTFDRFFWRLRAAFTSRTYEEILFEKTQRFQVEEVFLLDSTSLALISYASCDPARHSSIRKIEKTVHHLASQFRDPNGNVRPSFILSDNRNVVSHSGKYITLLAVVHGMPTEMALRDLAFSIDQIEERFHERFQTNGSALFKLLQPFLEDCLLIQAPSSAA
jgi:hypothetical protein